VSVSASFAGRLALAATTLILALAQAGCRGKLGADCRCASDCRAGLVCLAEGDKALAEAQCYDAGIIGECVEAIEADSDGESGPLPTEAPMFDDLHHSKRDFQPGESLSDSGTTSTTTTGETTGTSTGTTGTSTGTGTTGTTTGTSGTSTGTETGTSTGTTSGTSTGTETGTSTGTTGTTGPDTTGGSTGTTG
jgi:hypothetical protein